MPLERVHLSTQSVILPKTFVRQAPDLSSSFMLLSLGARVPLPVGSVGDASVVAVIAVVPSVFSLWT